MRTALAAALLFTLAACQPGETVGPQPDAFFAIKDSSVTHSLLHRPDPGAERDIWMTEKRRHFTAGFVLPMEKLHEVINRSGDWQTADRELRAYLAEVHLDPAIQSQREARIAAGFLPGHLVNNGPLTPVLQEAIAYYATLVIENRDFQSTPRLGPALDRLEGYWSEAKLAEAREIVEAASRHFDRVRTMNA